MADELQDALACAAPDASAGSAGGERANEAMFDAFFFRWRLGGPERDAAALDAVRGLISRGKLVALQLAVRDLAALRAQQDWLRALATDRALMRSPNVAWDVGLEDAARPFFVASVCHRDPASVDALAEARELLTALGVPLRPALAPFQFHQGCPLLLPQAHILLPSGQRLLCNDDVGSGDAGFAPRQASEARCAQQLEAACARCAALPFCLSRCPKHPAPTPGDAECERVKTRARAELVRLVACGQLPAEPLEPLEPRRSAS